MTGLPTFYHVPKNAGTYAISVFIGLMRKHRIIMNPEFHATLKHESVRNIEVYHDNVVVARILALDWTDWCSSAEHIKKLPHSPIDYKITLDHLKQLILPGKKDLELFTIIIESDGFPIHETICDIFNKENELCRFLIVREPISRQKSIFNYLTSQDSVHEYSHHNIKQDEEAQVHFDKFLTRHGKKEDSWIIRTLLDVPVEDKLTDEHYKQATNILDKFKISDIKKTDDLIEEVYEQCYQIKLSKIEPHFLNAVVRNESTNKKSVEITNMKEVERHLKWDIELYNRYSTREIVAPEAKQTMNIYTYYENIDFAEQQPLLELWKKSWEDQGFKPIVLNKRDAEAHPKFKWFDNQMRIVHEQVMGEPIQDYGMSCYYRWLAYANQKTVMNDEKFLVSDYDIINTGVSVQEMYEIARREDLHFMDHACPCIVYGDANQFDKLVEDFVVVSILNMENLQSRNIGAWYHDQEFFQHNVFVDNCNKGCKLYDDGYIHSRSRPLIAEWPQWPVQNMLNRIVHFSHTGTHSIEQTIPEFKGWDQDKLRVHLIEKTLKQL